MVFLDAVYLLLNKLYKEQDMTFKFLAQLSHFITMLFGIALGMTICLLYQYTTKIFIFDLINYFINCTD